MRVMQTILPPELLLTIPAEPGTFVIAMYLGAFTAAFALRLERRHR
jgi:hypothetical protein